ncbi:hypothetical protein ACFPM7_23160 [Actinokineospora guangxiensis]|uniref:Uncharacterized protein n=1 Tax=Actinokineospora guangxiensis TaxID=1490288 RepID=A0ABW0EUU0_9PSEU
MLTGRVDTALADPPPRPTDPYADILGWLLTAPPAARDPEPATVLPAATGTEPPC